MILDLINQSKRFVKTKNPAECRQSIKTYIKKVMVYEENVEVIFHISTANEDISVVEPIKTMEDIAVLQRDYRAGLA